MRLFMSTGGPSKDTLENEKTKGEKGRKGLVEERDGLILRREGTDNLSFFQRNLRISLFTVDIVMSRF